MKRLRKFTAALLAAAAALCSAAAAFAAEESPRIILNASGIEGQYILRLEQLGSRFESVQFDVLIEGDVAAPQVDWQDDSPAHFQQIIDRRENGKTVLTVYIDRLRPIANSGSVNLAALTFSQNIPAAAFSAGSELIALDEHQEETLFSSPAFSVTGAASEGGGSSGSSSSSGNSSSENGSSSGGGSGSAGSSFSGEGSADSSRHSFSEKTVLQWEDVSGEKAGEIQGRKTLSLRVLEGQVISSDIFRQAQQQGLWLLLDYGSYTWLFDTSKGLEIPAGRVFYDLSVQPLQFRNLSAAVEGSDLLQFEVAYSGALPCPASLSCRVGGGYAGKTVYLSRYNENAATLDFQASAQVEENGMASFSLADGARYVISEKNFWEAPAQQAAGTAASAMAASKVIVPPEDELKEDEAASESAPEEQPQSSSAPEEPQEEEGEREEPPSSGNRWWEANIFPLLLLFLSAVAVVILLLERCTGKKRRYRR